MPLRSFFYETTSQDNKITQSYSFKKLCLIVGMIISMICIFIFVAFIGNSVYSYDEEAFVRNTPCKFFTNSIVPVSIKLADIRTTLVFSIAEKDPQ